MPNSTNKIKTALVTGAGGFIGHHLVKRLKSEGYKVIGVDLKYPEYEQSPADWFAICDLRDQQAVKTLAEEYPLSDVTEVYALAADMGGMGFIAFNDLATLTHNVQINLNTAALVADEMDHPQVFFASSACVYPEFLQDDEDYEVALKEDEAYPALPQDGYGWEKLYSELVWQAYRKDELIGPLVIGRFHNIAGPLGTWRGGREKAPAAMCRKVAEVVHGKASQVEVWGDGHQRRSFCWIDDCLDAVRQLMWIEYDSTPINIGSAQSVSINELLDNVIRASNTQAHIPIVHVDGPVGVRARNSDNTYIREVLDWEPSTPLQEWIVPLYQWVESQVYDSYVLD